MKTIMKTLHTIYTTFAKRLVMSLVLLLVAGSVWGAEELAYTIIFSNNTSSNTEIKETTNATTVIAAESRKYVLNTPFSGITKAYYGDTKTSIRLGTSSAAGGLTIALSEDGKVYATKVVVSCGYWKSGETPNLSLNNKTSQNITSSEANLTFDVNGDITNLYLNTNRRAYIYSIQVFKKVNQSYTITAQSNNTDYGTVSLSGTTITAIPKTGYRVSTSSPYTITTGSADVTQNGNLFSVTPKENCTVTINFEAIPKHKIAFETGGLVAIDAVEVQEGVTYTLIQDPSASLTENCEYKTFVGWTKVNTIADASECPETITSVQMSTSDITLYTVYSKTEGGGGSSEESVTFSQQGYINGGAVTSYSGEDFKINFNKGSNNNNAPMYYDTGDAIRAYGGNNFVISSDLNIVKVVLTFASGEGSNTISTDCGTYSNGTWTGSANSVKFTIGGSSGHRRIQKIVVTLNGGGTTTYSLTPNCVVETIATLYPNGGEGSEKDIVTKNRSLDLSTCPFAAPTGYSFSGWNTQEDGNGTHFTAQKYDDWDETITKLYAQWQINTYKVTWIVDDEETEVTYNYGAAITPPANPTKEGHTFAAWSPAVDATMPAKDVTYTAQWTINKYTLTWVLGDGKVETAGTLAEVGATGTISGEVEYNSEVIAPIVVSKASNFIGWTPEVAATMPAKDVTYTAKWEAKALTNYRTLCVNEVVFNTNGGNELDPIEYTVKSATILAASLPTPYKLGYDFAGWYIDPELTTPVTDIEPKDHSNGVILYAKWTPTVYTITFDANGGEAVASQNYTIETATFDLPQTTKIGYTFAGWYLGAEKITQIVQGTTGDKNLVAQWTPNTNTLYVVKHYQENLDGTYPTEAADTDNLTGTTGASVTPSVKSYEGFTSPETQTVIIAADGSLVVEYKYTRNSYQLTWKSDESTEISSAELKYGAEIVKPSDPTKDGYIFAGWNPDVPTTMPATDKTFVAQWTKLHTITWYANGVEYTEGDPTTIVPNNGTLEKLPTPPSAPSGCSAKQFIGWSETNLGMTESAAPADLFTEVPSTAILEDKKYYAVFYNPAAASGNYEKVTTAPADWSGEYLIVYETGNVAFNGGLTTLDAVSNTISVTITNNAIEANDATNAAKFTIAAMSGGYSIQSASGYYIGNTTASNELSYNNTKALKNEISLTDGVLSIKAKDNATASYLKFNNASGQKRFRYYNSGQEAIALYKKAADNETYVTECDNCVETTLTITPDQASVNLNEDGKATVTFSVEGGNGGAITYAVTPSTNVTITDNQLDFTKEGEYTIYATQEKTGDNCPTKSDFVTITVTKNPVLYFETEPSLSEFEAVKCGAHTPLKNKQFVSLKAYNLTEDVTATVSSGYLVARTASATLAEYQTSVSLTKTGEGKIHSNYNTVYVIASPSLMTPETTGTLTFTTTGGNTLTVNLSTAEVTCEQHTLTFKNYNSRTRVKYYGGQDVVEPEAPTGVCQDRFAYEFDGWAEEIVSDGATTYKKVDFSTYTMPNRNTILYAVYRYPGAKGDYEKVTTAPADWSGEYLIVYESGKKAFNGALKDLDATDNYVPVTISSDKITATDEVNKSKFTIAAMDGGYSIQSASGYYIGCTASADKNGLTASTTEKYANTISLTDIISKSYYLRYNTVNDENRFRYYKSNTNDDQKAVALYKRADAYLYTSNPDCIAKVEAVKPTAVASKFSVAADKQVQFSTGNLQYHNKDGIWRFAENQYDVIGDDNINIGNPDYRDWVDMFGWSSDGKYGVNASNNNDDYQGAFVDWGRVFADAQYGSQPVNQWYTMSYAEWNYLLNQRNNHASLQQLAAIQLAADEEIFGNLLFPDEWTMPADVTSTLETDEDGVEYYLYDLANWSKLEAAGAVFLPAAGRRTGGYGNTTVSPHIEDDPNNFDEEDFYRWQDNTNYTGYYWTSTRADGKVYFAINLTKTGSGEEDYKASKFQLWQEDARYGQSVRLVRECASVQVVEWKENSVMVMTNAAPEKASVKINGGTPQETTLSAEHVKVDHGVYQIGAADMDANALIEITFDTDNTLLTIPYIATGESTGAPANSDLVILNGATYTAKNNETLRNVTIYGGGTLVVPENVTLSVNSLTMRVGGVENGEYQHLYPQLILQGTLNNASGTINLDYLTTNNYYYPISVPYTVIIKDIHYPIDIYGKNVDAGNTGSFQFKYYDGAERAKGNGGWEVLDEETVKTLTPGTGYAIWGIPKKIDGTRQTFGIHRLPMAAGKTLAYTAEAKEVTINSYDSDKDINKGWNYIANPFLSHYGDMTDDEDVSLGYFKWNEETKQWEYLGKDQRYVVFTNDCQNYTAEEMTSATIPAFSAFFVQALREGALAFASPVPVAQSLAPRRSAEQDREITTGIILSGEGYKDRTGLLIADNFSEAYEFNADLSKFENQDINLYTISDHGKLAYMAINKELAKETIPVGYSVSVEGTYTIAFDELRYNDEDIHELLLIDYDRNETTDLLQNEYQFYSEKGEYTQRLALQVALAPKVSTDIEQTEQSNILIYREGNMLRLDNLPDQATVTVYDAVGRLMQQSNASEQLQLSLHGGYYLIHVVSAENAVVLETYIP